jgi:hypothetical protein
LTTTPQSFLAPFLPTALETLLLAIYPTTLLLGSLFSTFNPLARTVPYNVVSQSHPPELAPSYFAQKKNLFNILFVKRGWFWTTLAFFVFLALHPSVGPSRRFVLTPRRAQGVGRWALVTGWWWVVTQGGVWGGPGIIDRLFKVTGGMCEIALAGEGQDIGMGRTREFVTAQACKVAGGQWKGGHDISGHVFLLVLGSAFLWLEFLPVVLRYSGLREQRVVRHRDGKVGRASPPWPRTENEDRDGKTRAAKGGISVPLGVVILSWWMLLMTAAYFHTWLEKVCLLDLRLHRRGLTFL